MTEEQIKLLCNLAVQNPYRPFIDWGKAILRQAIGDSRNLEEPITVAITSLAAQVPSSAMMEPRIGRLQ